MKRSSIDAVELEKMIGRNLELLRLSQNVSQTELAKKMKVSNWQLAKYETGVNRISAGRLATASKALNVPIEYFFRSCNVQLSKLDPRNEVQLLKMTKLFVEVFDHAQQDALLNLIESLIPEEKKKSE